MNRPCGFCNSREHGDTDCPKVAWPAHRGRKFTIGAVVMASITSFILGLEIGAFPVSTLIQGVRLLLRTLI